MDHEVRTPPPDLRVSCVKTVGLVNTHPHAGRKRRQIKRTRSAPDCKHSIASKIKIGLCAMDKKAQSKPMREIISRLLAGGEFEVVTFGDKVILEMPVESWPLCDVMLSWHSEGFPLRKAQAYVELRRPFLINDVHMQDVLLDRRRVYKALMDNSIPVPRHIIVNREGALEPCNNTTEGMTRTTISSSSTASSPTASPARPQTPPVGRQLPGTLSPWSSGPDQPGTADGGLVLPDPSGFVEGEDCVELNGMRIDKPFVEKPASGEDHNIYIYYPHSMGGGVKRLFRKVDNKSADYDPHHPGTVRRDGSYIYEEFLTTGGTDVKVYTVGPRYAHAEARKSPVVDGKVNRTADGKEVRFPVLLSPQEKEIARMVCLAFGQRVCGFDLLRSETGRSFVCDVNGWSFVKNSKKYYDDTAGILRSIILSQLAPHRLFVAPTALKPLEDLLEEATGQHSPHAGDSSSNHYESFNGGSSQPSSPSMSSIRARQSASGNASDEIAAGDGHAAGVDSIMKEVSSLQDLTSIDGLYDDDGTDDSSSTGVGAADPNKWLELRCVLAVIRHGDRTPKQKMKVTVTQGPLLELFNKYKDSKGKQAKLKSPGQLQELLDVTRQLLADMEAKANSASSNSSGRLVTGSMGGPSTEEENREHELHEEQREKLRIVRTVLEQGGTFSGINRKVQLKPTKWNRLPPKQQTQAGAEAASQASATSSDAAKSSEGNAARQQQHGLGSGTVASGGNSGASKRAQGVVGSISISARSSSTGGTKESPDEPQVTELLLILKYGGVLTHAGRAQAEELGKMFRMIMYPRYGPAGGGLLRLHSTYRHDMKIYSSDEGRVQMSAAAFIQGLLDLEGSSLTPILVSLVTKNASMLDAFGKGASDDILAAKNILYQHLTWDPDKAASLCSRLTLPLQTPANVTPPMSPRGMMGGSTEGALGPFSPLQAPLSACTRVLDPESSTSVLPPTPSGVVLSSAPAGGAAANSGFPTTTSCMEVLQQGSSFSNAAAVLLAASGGKVSPIPEETANTPNSANDTSTTAGQQQDQPPQEAGLPRNKGSTGALPAINSFNAAAAINHSSSVNGSAHSLSKLGSTNLSWPVRQAEARAAAVAGIRNMPEKPLALLYQLVDLMKVLVDELRQKCLDERAEPGALAAAAGSNTNAYSSLTTSPDEWRLDESRPCSGERLLLMFDRWRKLLKSFYNEKKQQFDISKVPDIYDSAKYDAIHNSHLQLSTLEELYAISRQLASVVVPHEYGLDGPGKLLIGSKICAELLGKLMCDLDSMKEESIITAAIEDETAAARAAADKAADKAAERSSGRSSRARLSSHSSLLNGSYDAFDAEFGQMSLEDERMRPVRPANYFSGLQTPTNVVSSATAAAATSLLEGLDARAGPWNGGVDGGEGGGANGDQEQEQDMEEKETLHRLCPTYASDVNSPLRHVRTRIYFTSESHIHSLINVLRFCHLPYLAANSTSITSVSHAPCSVDLSQHSSVSSFAQPVAAATAAYGSTVEVRSQVTSTSNSDSSPAAANEAAEAAAASAAAAAATAAATAVGSNPAEAPPAPAAVSVKPGTARSGSAFASATAAAANAAGIASGYAGPSSSGLVEAVGSGVGVNCNSAVQANGAQAVITPEGQALLDDTDEFDYLTHIVFRMYENKQVPVESPDRFFVEVQFSNGANHDPTAVVPLHADHTLPTQPRRLLTSQPGVTLQALQELVGKYARGKNTPSNYQLQVALRAPLSQANSHATSKLPTPGVSRQPSGGRLPPATAAALLAAGPGTAPSAPGPLPASVAAAAAKAAAAAVTSTTATATGALIAASQG